MAAGAKRDGAHDGPRERAARVRRRIARAAERAGRDPGEVEILPVTKGHPVAAVETMAELGFRRVGENRVGEAAAKVEDRGRMGLRWHMVGHLQRNKAGRAVSLFDEVESVDSLRLARKLQRELVKSERESLDVLVQVNTSGEASKFGFEVHGDPGAADDEVAELCRLDRLRVRGVMTMAPLTSEEDVLRRTFRRTREVHERWAAELDGYGAGTLSMGMSNDFEIAIEEGATRVRLGTVLVGARPDG